MAGFPNDKYLGPRICLFLSGYGGGECPK